MNSRERVRCAINHQEPDRVPIDLGGSRVTGIHVDEYCELAKYYGLDVLPPKVYDSWQMLAKPDILMSRCLKSDVIVLESPVEAFGLRNDNWKIWTTFAGNPVLVSGDYDPVEDEKGYLHICGKNGKRIAQMPPGGLYYDIECPTGAGIDILNPVQVTTANMDPKRLKEEFGDRIVFWGGGADTQTVLPYGTKEEVAAQTKERIDIFGPGGGFVFTPVHNLQYGVPLENVDTMVRTIIEYGNYPLA